MTTAVVPPDAPAWRRAVAAFVQEFAYGDVLERAWLDAALGVAMPPRGTPKEYAQAWGRWMAAYRPFRAELLEVHKMDLLAMGSGLFQVVEPAEQTASAMEDLARGIAWSLHVAERRVANVNTARLSDPARQARLDALGKIGALRALTAKELPTVATAERRIAAGGDGDDERGRP